MTAAASGGPAYDPATRHDIGAALAVLRQRCGARVPSVAVVLGTGWKGVTAHLSDPLEVPYADLSGFPRPTVAGHPGSLWLGRLGAHEVAVLAGRKHAYETGEPVGMKTALRTLHAWGCRTLVQTNAAGSLHARMPPGDLMVLADHLNIAQRSPLTGEEGDARFVSMVGAYDAGLRALAHTVAREQGLVLHEGIYALALGPQFETPAEIRMFIALGADAVGMSTVPETIIARHAGMKVLALSLMTNLGAGLSDESLSHEHTQAQAAEAAPRASAFLAALVGRLPAA